MSRYAAALSTHPVAFEAVGAVAGEIIELPVEDGMKVKKGDVLVKIKPDSYKALLEQQEAAFRARATAQAKAWREAMDRLHTPWPIWRLIGGPTSTQR